MSVLEARLCALAGLETVAAYAGSGAGVRVPWQRVLEGAGMGHLTENARKKLLGVLKLPPAVQDALAGKAVSQRTLRELAQQPEDAALALVDQATNDAGQDGNVGAALRMALDASSEAETGEGEESGVS